MAKICLLSVLCTLSVIKLCESQYFKFRNNHEAQPTTTPLPFPTCRADNIDCLRRGLRTFFFLMDSGHLGMTPIDPMIVNSVTVAMPEEQTSFLLRKLNVTGGRWTKLAERRFNLMNGKSGVRFTSDLHVTGEITFTMAARIEPFTGFVTIDMQDVESNITYAWSGERGPDKEDYILIGPERIAVRNMRTPTFFLQPKNDETYIIEQILHKRPSILDYLTNEITAALMHSVVDNFRLFATNVPVKYYYQYF